MSYNVNLTPLSYMIGVETEPVEGGGAFPQEYAIGQDFPIIPPAMTVVQQAAPIAEDIARDAGLIPGGTPTSNAPPGALVALRTGRPVPPAPGTPLVPRVFVPTLQASPWSILPPGAGGPTQTVAVIDPATGAVSMQPAGAYGPVTSPYEYDTPHLGFYAR